MAFRKKKKILDEDLLHNKIMAIIRNSEETGIDTKDIETIILEDLPEIRQAGRKGLRLVWQRLGQIGRTRCALKGTDLRWRLRKFYPGEITEAEVETPTPPEPELAPVEHVYHGADVVVTQGNSTVSYTKVTVRVVLGSLATLVVAGWLLGLLG